jgi:hypothetical protein
LLSWSTTLADAITRAAVIDGASAVEALLDREVRRALDELSRGPIAPASSDNDDAPKRAR